MMMSSFLLQFWFFVLGWSLTTQGQSSEIQHVHELTCSRSPCVTDTKEHLYHHHFSHCVVGDDAQHSFSSACKVDDKADIGMVFFQPAALWENDSQ